MEYILTERIFIEWPLILVTLLRQIYFCLINVHFG